MHVKRIRGWQEILSRAKHVFIEDASWPGGFYAQLIIILSLFSLGFWKISLHYAISLILVMLSILFIRSMIFKPRPKPVAYGGWIERLDAASFPSMHAARAALLSAYALMLSTPAFGISSMIVTLLVGVSRVSQRKHDWLDVLAGFALGAGIGLFTLTLYPLIG